MGHPTAQRQPQPSTPEQHSTAFDKAYTFRLRRHATGSTFPGLWEMTMLDPKGKVIKTISDADALNFCMENLMGEMENEGF